MNHVNEKILIKRSISTFFSESEDILPAKFSTNLKHLLYNITNIVTVSYEDRIEVEIETYRPGLIIGKGGRVINALKAFVNNDVETDKIIEFGIKENKFWFYEELQNEGKTDIECAMEWWNGLEEVTKEQYCYKYFALCRRPNNLTGSEIEYIWKKTL